MSAFARRLQRTLVVSPDGGTGDEYGSPGNRPAILTKPNTSTSGPVTAPTVIMTGSEALAALAAAVPGPDGFRVLSGVHIYGGLTLTGALDVGYRFENCIIDAYDQAQTAEAYAAVRAWWSDNETMPTFGTDYVEFVRCEMINGANSAVLGGYFRLLKCNIHGGYDAVQQHRIMEVYGCYLHDNWYTTGEHSDSFQVLNGSGSSATTRSWFHYNNVQAFSGDMSPVAGLPINRCLQTGANMFGNVHITFNHNWFNGGLYYAVDGSNPTGGEYIVDYIFRNNLFGDDIQTALYPGTLTNADFDSSNVWESTGVPVA